MSWRDAFREVRDAHTLVIDAETRTKQALNHNPSVAERRRLNTNLVELGLARAKLRSRRTAILRERTAVIDPTPQQAERVKKLTMEVQGQTSAALTVAMTLDLAGRVLDLVNEMAG